MTCKSVRSFLLDHDLYEKDILLLRQHLAHVDNCPECWSVVAEYSAVHSILQDKNEDHYISKTTTHVSEALPRKRVLRWSPVFKVAAAILIAFGAYMTGKWGHEKTTSQQKSQTVMAGNISDESVRDLTLGFGEVAELFNGQARWLLLSDTKADVGLEALPGKVSGRVMVLRVTLLRDGIPQKTADVAMLSGSSLSKRLPLVGGKILQLALSANNDDGKANIGLWAEVQESQASSVRSVGAVSAELMLRDGETVPAGRFHGAQGEYEVRLSYASITAREAAL